MGLHAMLSEKVRGSTDRLAREAPSCAKARRDARLSTRNPPKSWYDKLERDLDRMSGQGPVPREEGRDHGHASGTAIRRYRVAREAGSAAAAAAPRPAVALGHGSCSCGVALECCSCVLLSRVALESCSRELLLRVAPTSRGIEPRPRARQEGRA